MGLFALGIEHPLDMTVQRFHDPDARHHRRTTSRHEQQNLDRGSPLLQVGFLLRQLRDVVGCFLQRDELATVRAAVSDPRTCAASRCQASYLSLSAAASTVFAISCSAITDANSSIEYILAPSYMDTPENLSTTCHSIAFANASFAVSVVTASVRSSRSLAPGMAWESVTESAGAVLHASS